MKTNLNSIVETVAIKEFSELKNFESGIHELINNTKINFVCPHVAVFKAVNFHISE
jgi:hypothetical protein